MVAFNRFDSFTDAEAKKLHNLSADTLKVMLTDTAPSRSNAVKSDISEISAGNGYTAGGYPVTQTVTNSAGTENISITGVTVAAGAGVTMASWRYLVLYNATANLLIGWWDAGSEITLANSATEVVTFANPVLSEG